MRAAAVCDQQPVRRQLACDGLGSDAPMRKIDCARNMSPGVGLWAATVDDNEVGDASGYVGSDISAVSFKDQARLEVRSGDGRIGGVVACNSGSDQHNDHGDGGQ